MVKIFRYFKKSFEVYKRNFVPIILIMLLFLVIYFSIFSASRYLETSTLSSIENFENYTVTENMSAEEYNKVFGAFQQHISNFILFFLFLIVIGVITVFLQAGFWGICLKGIKEKVNIRIFFTTIKERGLSYFLAIILLSLILLAIETPFLIVSIILLYGSPTFFWVAFFLDMAIYFLIMPFFIFVYPAVVSGKRVSESLSQSFSLGKKNYFGLLLLIILFSVSFLVFFIPIMGILLIYFLISPLFIITICSYYLEASRREVKGKRK